MPKFIVNYVKVIDYLSTKFGRLAMYLIFVMIGTLLLDAVTRNVINIPLSWCVEMAQFTMTAYYIVGGPYSMQLDSHVRMDLIYSRFSPRNRARLDSFTAIFLVIYLVVPVDWRDLEHQLRDRVWPTQVFHVESIDDSDQADHGVRYHLDAAAGHIHLFQGPGQSPRDPAVMSYEAIAIIMFVSMLLMMLTGQRVFAAIGIVSTLAALLLWGDGGVEMPFNAAFKLFNWYPLLTLPLFIYMGYILSESGIADDLYAMFHVWFGGLRGGLAVGTILLMVVISAMNGLSVAGMAIGATIALPEMLKRGYDKIMITGVVQAGSSLGILVPPSVVLVLYGMIARQPVGQAVAGRCHSRPDDGDVADHIHRRPLPLSAPSRTYRPQSGSRHADEGKAQATARRHHPVPDFLFHDRPVHHGHHQPGGKLRGRRDHRHDGRPVHASV